MKKISFLFALVVLVTLANAESIDDAKECVKFGIQKNEYTEDSQSLKNSCSEKIHLAWCHTESARKGTKDTKCGVKKKYYTQHIVLKPGEVKSNLYSMPTDARIEIAACFGGYGSITNNMPDGTYECKRKASQKKRKDNEFTLECEGKKTKVFELLEARGIKKNILKLKASDKTVFTVNIDKKNSVNVLCENNKAVKNTSIVNKIKSYIRKEIDKKCKLNPQRCSKNKNSPVAFGVRS